MGKRSVVLLFLAAAGVAWLAVAALLAATTKEPQTVPLAGLTEGNVAEYRPAQGMPEPGGSPTQSNGDSKGKVQIEPESAVVPNVPKPEVVESSDAPYARRMRLGSKRSVLTPNIPHDWLRKYLESVDEVEHMFAGGNALTPEMIAILAEAGNVKHMSFGSIHLLSEEAALVLPLLTSVEKITIGTNHPFSSNSGPVEDEFNPLLSPFFLMPGVHTVEISGTINDELLRMVSEQSRITCLRLGNLDDLRREGKITTAGVMHLGRMSQLHELIMLNFTVGRHRIDLSKCNELFVGLANLKLLSLSGWRIKDEHLLPCIPQLKQLKYLNLSNTDITDEFYQRIDSTWLLEELHALGMSDLGIQAVATAPHLERLTVGKAATNVALGHLAASATRLSALDISNCSNITDAGLQALQQCTVLRELCIRDMGQLTKSGVLQLVGHCQIETIDLSRNQFVGRQFMEALLAAGASLKTVICYPSATFSKSDMQTLVVQYPEVTFLHMSVRDPWYR